MPSCGNGLKENYNFTEINNLKCFKGDKRRKGYTWKGLKKSSNVFLTCMCTNLRERN